MAEHTPLPWRINGYCARPLDDRPKGSRIISDCDDGFEFHIAAVGAHPGINADQARANADLIVKAVNNHHALVAELQRLSDLYGHQATADVLARVGRMP